MAVLQAGLQYAMGINMAKAIMVQGTMSNAGKSLLAAGLCRIFKQDGYKVAPFKSQNMALNSFITEEGLEMGRAQVMQAEAAGIKPSVYMNPILLKPTNDIGSQVIVNGEVVGNMSAREYFAYKKNLVPDVLRAYHKLEADYDIIVIEGAGSPAEINLKQEDIVNMGMAKMAKAPVLLVGDIDRGGVFAQLVGTVMLLEEDEKAMIKGLIINKFRGDKTILEPGVAMLEERAGIPVVGVAPYLQIEVEDEDSLTERFSGNQEVGLIDIAVIRLPRISNFTDFNPFESMEGVSLRYVHSVSELKNPDMIILPGTKNTMEDLLWMRQNGLEAAVLKQAAAGKIIFGVCGGYQMLGETLSDPSGVEAGGEIKGMGLLPMDTVFEKEKTRTRVSGTFGEIDGALSSLSGVRLEGYEIHMGSSTLKEGCVPLTSISDGVTHSKEKPDGAYRDHVYGSYVHGIFDKEEVAKEVIMSLGRMKGIDATEITSVDFQEFKETQYDILASELRKHFDMKEIYRILEAGI
nr:cobyric acid synthase [Robinsoniella peoriensis]